MRLREYRLSLRELYSILSRGNSLPDVVCVPQVSLPDGARIHHLAPSHGGMFIVVMVEHESFDEVPDGCDPPQAEIGFRMQSFPVVRPGGFMIDSRPLTELLALRDEVQRQIDQQQQVGVSMDAGVHVKAPMALSVAEDAVLGRDVMTAVKRVVGDNVAVPSCREFEYGGLKCIEVVYRKSSSVSCLVWCRRPFNSLTVDGTPNPLVHRDFALAVDSARRLVQQQFARHYKLSGEPTPMREVPFDNSWCRWEQMPMTAQADCDVGIEHAVASGRSRTPAELDIDRYNDTLRAEREALTCDTPILFEKNP